MIQIKHTAVIHILKSYHQILIYMIDMDKNKPPTFNQPPS